MALRQNPYFPSILESQSRTKEPLRNVTADTRRYILQKLVADTGISRAGEITGAKITQWLVQLKQDGKSKDTLWTYHPDVQVHVVITHNDEQYLDYVQVGRTHVFLPPAFAERTRSIRFPKTLLGRAHAKLERRPPHHLTLPFVWYHTNMRKPRDYKAEHARRSVTKDIKTSGGGELSFWRQTNDFGGDR